MKETLTKYQLKIVEELKLGARLQSSEGKNYKTWLVYPNGDKSIIRRDSSEKICELYERNLIFGEHLGIRWRF